MAAPTTVKVYPLDGVVRDFPVDFDYLARQFIVVTLRGAGRRELVQNSEYTFLNSTRIRTTATWGPAQGYTNIEVRRVTSATERLVTFNDASILRAADLNLAELQTVHIAQEARDLVSDALGTDDNGNLDARNRRIGNLGEPVGEQDAMTLHYYQSRLNEVFTWRNETLTARDATFVARDATLAARDAGFVARDITLAARDVTLGYRDTTQGYMTTTLGYRDTANQHRVDAQAARDLALQYRNEAEGFKNTASDKAAIVRTIEDTANSAKAEAQAATAATTGLMDNDLQLFMSGTQRRDIKVKAGTHAAQGVQRAGVRFTDVDVVAVERFNQSTGAYTDTPVRVSQGTGDVILSNKKILGVDTPTANDHAANKAYADGKVAKTGDTMSGPLVITSVPAQAAGALHVTANIGGGWVDWGTARKYALQVDAQDDFAAYGAIRWTHWGASHIAAIDAYMGGSAGGTRELSFHIGATARAWSFQENEIYRGKGGNVWGSWNFNPASKINGDGAVDVGFEGNNYRKPYIRKSDDGSVRRLVANASGNGIELAWDGRLRCYVDGGPIGAVLLTNDGQNSSYWHCSSGRVGRNGDLAVASGYFEVIIDGTSYGIPFNPSDARRKENIVPSTEDAIEKVKQIKFYSFNFKPGALMDSSKVYKTGFIAQQLLGIDKTLVYGDDNPDMTLSPDINALLSLALKATQQLTARVEALEAELKALKG